MRTNDEILESWDTEGIYTDWYAIDSYNSNDGKVRRMFVGTEEDALTMMRENYAVPTELAMQPFYRCSLISESAAREFFEGVRAELDERGVLSATEASEMLGVSRMRVNQLLNEGKLDGFRVGNAWSVYRYSVENRLHG